MTTQIKWEVAAVKASKELNGKTNVVSQVQWQVTATDGTLNGSVYGNQDLQVDESNFTSFDQLTEQTMIGWVKAAIGDEQVATFEAKAIANMTPVQTVSSEPVAVALPWAK
jgi:hypothetical protein